MLVWLLTVKSHPDYLGEYGDRYQYVNNLIITKMKMQKEDVKTSIYIIKGKNC